MKEENERISRRTVKIILVLFVCSLLVATSIDLWGGKFLPTASVSQEAEESLSMRMRNRHIDRMKPSVKLSENSV